MINLIIPGEPIAKGRPRFSKFGAHTDEKTLNYETLVKELFIVSKQERLEGMLAVRIDCYFTIPESASKKKKIAMENNTMRPTKKPDLDNIAKICLDALNKLAYKDDSQIVSLYIRKWYGINPRVEIELDVCL